MEDVLSGSEAGEAIMLMRERVRQIMESAHIESDDCASLLRKASDLARGIDRIEDHKYLSEYLRRILRSELKSEIVWAVLCCRLDDAKNLGHVLERVMKLSN